MLWKTQPTGIGNTFQTEKDRGAASVFLRDLTAFSIVSGKTPCPLAGAFTDTSVTAPAIRPFCKMAQPLTSDRP